MKINPEQSVGELAAERRELIPVLENEGVDYCCEGSRSLKDACYIAGVPLEKVVSALESVDPETGEWYLAEPDWRKESMASVIDHILSYYHTRCRARIARITERLKKMTEDNGGSHPLLARLKALFAQMSEQTEEHIREEEVVVFPCLIQAEKAVENHEPIPHPFRYYSDLTHPLRILQWENGLMGREWREIHEITDHFKAPPGEEAYWAPLYRDLVEMETDARKHVHLENNILLGRAIQMGLLNGDKTK